MQANMEEGDFSAFSQRLAEFKHEGSIILVKGTEKSARLAVMNQLLGEKDRTPIFVLLDADRSIVTNRLGNSDERDQAPIIEYNDFYRSATDTAYDSTGAYKPELQNPTDLIEELSITIDSMITQREISLGPSNLRVSLNPMSPIVDRFSRNQIEEFLDDFRTLMRNHAGMAHASIALPREQDQYRWLDEAFDIVVETQSIDGVPHERWRLPDTGHITEWFVLDDVKY